MRRVVGSSPTWGAKIINHFREFHRGGFFFRASFGPGFEKKWGFLTEK
jgi:hypothetical protein